MIDTVCEYMALIGHTEFGPNYVPMSKDDLMHSSTLDINHWLEQWLLTYTMLVDSCSSIKNLHFVCYEKLCADLDSWKIIQGLLGINCNATFTLKQKEIRQPVDAQLIQRCAEVYRRLADVSV